MIREDPKNRNLLYLGTEYAFYVSLDGGKEWKRFMNGLPTVRIDDIIVHPRDNDLIVGTHGRSIWIIDDISALQQMTDQTRRQMRRRVRRPSGDRVDQRHPEVQSLAEGAKNLPRAEPGARIGDQLLAEGGAGSDVRIAITDVTGREIRAIDGTKNAGLNRVQWDLLPSPAGRRGGGPGLAAAEAADAEGPTSVAPGTYLVKVTTGDRTIGQKTVVVEADTTFMR